MATSFGGQTRPAPMAPRLVCDTGLITISVLLYSEELTWRALVKMAENQASSGQSQNMNNKTGYD